MTLIIGIRCSDGVVMGADGAATLTSHGQATVQQRSHRKLVATGAVLTGIAGHVGLAQRIRGELEARLADGTFTGRTDSMVHQMRIHLWRNIVEIEHKASHSARDGLGFASAGDSAQTETLLATVMNSRPELVHLDEKCAPTIIADDLPFAAIGAGQQIADPFLAFSRRVFWPTGLPSLATGIFSVLWTLTHVVDASAVGISKPFQLAVLSRAEAWSARELSHGELAEHEASVADAEAHLRDWGKRFTDDLPNEQVPLPPV